jgi:hypothetical protein
VPALPGGAIVADLQADLLFTLCAACKRPAAEKFTCNFAAPLNESATVCVFRFWSLTAVLPLRCERLRPNDSRNDRAHETSDTKRNSRKPILPEEVLVDAVFSLVSPLLDVMVTSVQTIYGSRSKMNNYTVLMSRKR